MEPFKVKGPFRFASLEAIGKKRSLDAACRTSEDAPGFRNLRLKAKEFLPQA
jgi:hypothetical protein